MLKLSCPKKYLGEALAAGDHVQRPDELHVLQWRHVHQRAAGGEVVPGVLPVRGGWGSHSSTFRLNLSRV
jgi:hypothetical protein